MEIDWFTIGQDEDLLNSTAQRRCAKEGIVSPPRTKICVAEASAFKREEDLSTALDVVPSRTEGEPERGQRIKEPAAFRRAGAQNTK